MKLNPFSPFKESDLDLKDGPVEGARLKEAFRRFFEKLNPYLDGVGKLSAKGVSLAENLRADVVTGKFSHGVAQRVALKDLTRANSALLLGAKNAAVAAFPLVRMVQTRPGERALCEVTLFFNDPDAASVPCTLLLLEEGQQCETVPTWVEGGGGATTSAPWSLATKPTVADSRDEEFEGTAFSGWTEGATKQSTTISPYAAISTANHWRHSWNILRPSWLLLQGSTGGNANAIIHKAVTFNTNDFVYMRIAWPRKPVANASLTDNEGQIQLRLSATSGGVPSGTDYVLLYMDADAGGDIGINYRRVEGGVVSELEFNLPDYSNPNQLLRGAGIEYLGIHKLSGTYHFWFAGSECVWNYLGFAAYGGAALDRVSVFIGAATSTLPGNIIVGLDFIRFLQTDSNLP